MRAELPLVGGTYDDAPSTSQRTINLYAELVEVRGRSRLSLRNAAGMETFGQVSSVGGRGSITMGGVPYKVIGQRLYSFSSNGGHTELGNVSGVGQVSMAQNGRYVVIVTGISGHYYDSVLGVFGTIDHEYFRPASVVLYVDGYFVFLQKGTSNLFISALNDPTTGDATEVQSYSGDPNPLVSIIEHQGNIVLLGSSSSTTWRNIAGLDFPFANVEGSERDRGCIAEKTPAKLDNTIYFLGDDRVVYRMDGYIPARVSHHDLERFLSGVSHSEIQAAEGWSYTDNGHYFYVLTVADKTFLYDATMSVQLQQPIWTERQSDGNRWRASSYCNAYGKHLVTDRISGKVGELSTKIYQEYGEPMIWRRTVAPVHTMNDYYFMSRLELECLVGQGSLVDPAEVHLRTSRDAGKSWSSFKTRSLGTEGDYYKVCLWRRLGRFKTGDFELSGSSNAQVNLISLHGDIEVASGGR